MSASSLHLELELLLLVDELTHALQRLLQVENLDGPAKLTLDEYNLEKSAKMDYSDHVEDGLPHMGEAPELYSKKILYQYREGIEDTRKLYNNQLEIIIILDYTIHRNRFKQTLRFEYCVIPECKHNLLLTRALVHIWEICQAFSCTQSYNGEFGCRRIHLLMTDFRITGKFLNQNFNCNFMFH